MNKRIQAHARKELERQRKSIKPCCKTHLKEWDCACSFGCEVCLAAYECTECYAKYGNTVGEEILNQVLKKLEEQ